MVRKSGDFLRKASEESAGVSGIIKIEVIQERTNCSRLKSERRLSS